MSFIYKWVMYGWLSTDSWARLLGKPIKGRRFRGSCPFHPLPFVLPSSFTLLRRQTPRQEQEWGKGEGKLHDPGPDIPELPTISSITDPGLHFVWEKLTPVTQVPKCSQFMAFLASQYFCMLPLGQEEQLTLPFIKYLGTNNLILFRY